MAPLKMATATDHSIQFVEISPRNFKESLCTKV